VCIQSVPKVLHKNFAGDFNAKIVMEDTFEPTTWNEILHEIGYDNEVREVNSAIPKHLNVKSTMFPHCNID
jgi:hypothetical protein